ncbi:MAG: CBS domain-containing protein [Nitrososphaerota archaeon]
MDVRNRDVIGVQKDTNLYDIILNLTTNKISKIFIYDKNRPVGVITDKDVTRFLFIDKSGRDLHGISAQEIMNGICFIASNLTCQQAAQMMLINKISTLGISTKEKFDGIITKTDLLRYYATREHDKSKVSDYMTISYFSAPDHDRLYDIIRKMISCDISRIVITNKQNPIGVLTIGDIFRITMNIDKLSIVKSSLSNYSEQDGLWSATGFVGSQLAGEIMTEGIISADANTDMLTAAKTLLDKKIDSLGINNSNGQLVGLVDKTNILHALANSRVG